MHACYMVHIYLGNEKPQLKDLYDYVAVHYATNWKRLGRNLNIGENLLQMIEKDYPHNCEECCSQMLNNWLELTPDATWGMLVEAVDKVQSMQGIIPEEFAGVYTYTYAKFEFNNYMLLINKLFIKYLISNLVCI